MSYPPSRFEIQTSAPSLGEDAYIRYDATASGFPFRVVRQSDWITMAVWCLPNEYGLCDVLDGIECAYTVAEEDGYSFEEEIPLALESPNLDRIEEFEFTRPLGIDDFGSFGLPVEDISFLRTGGDLAHFTWSRGGEVGVLIYPKPRQINSAFLFMANLLPPSLRVDPEQLGNFVLGLPIPENSSPR